MDGQEDKQDLIKTTDLKQDYDYDFNLYDNQDVEENNLSSLKKKNVPLVSGLRSRYSNGNAELEKFAELSIMITRLSIEVETYTQDINILKRYLGILNEFWECIRNINGSHIQNEMRIIKNHCRRLVMDYNNGGTIPEKVHNNLLYYRQQLYFLRQRLNLGIEVDKINRGEYARAKKSIVE